MRNIQLHLDKLRFQLQDISSIKNWNLLSVEEQDQIRGSYVSFYGSLLFLYKNVFRHQKMCSRIQYFVERLLKNESEIEASIFEVSLSGDLNNCQLMIWCGGYFDIGFFGKWILDAFNEISLELLGYKGHQASSSLEQKYIKRRIA